MNIEECKINNCSPTNLLKFGFSKNENRIHEAQKPLALIQFLIKLATKNNQIILDPFMGSGTTAVVAKNLKRRFVGFEIVKDYYEQSMNRLNSDKKELTFEKNKKNKTLFDLMYDTEIKAEQFLNVNKVKVKVKEI